MILDKLLKPIISEAYSEGYKKGADDVVRRMAYVYDICRTKGREEGLADAGAIDLNIPKHILDELGAEANEIN